MAKAGLWAVTDAEERKHGERTGQAHAQEQAQHTHEGGSFLVELVSTPKLSQGQVATLLSETQLPI